MTVDIVTLKSASEEELTIQLAPNAGTEKGKRFLPELAYLSELLQSTTDVALDDSQEQQLDQVLSTLPLKAGIADLVEAMAGLEQLANLRVALQETSDKRRYAAFFDQVAVP